MSKIKQHIYMLDAAVGHVRDAIESEPMLRDALRGSVRANGVMWLDRGVSDPVTAELADLGLVDGERSALARHYLTPRGQMIVDGWEP